MDKKTAKKFMGKIEDLASSMSRYASRDSDSYNDRVAMRAIKSLNAAYDHLEDIEEARRRSGRMLVEGPGAGYEIYIRNMQITNDPEITSDGGTLRIKADVEFDADAYGYDWSTESVSRILDDEAFNSSYTGTIEFEIPDGFENRQGAEEHFYKGRTFDEMKTWYGGGWIFVPFDGILDMVVYYDEFWEVDLEKEESANGKLAFSDDSFAKFVKFSHSFFYRCYELREAVREYLEKQGLVCDWSDEYLDEFVASWVDDTDVIVDSTVEEIVDELKEQDAVYNPDEETNESYRRRGRMLRESKRRRFGR